MHHSSVISDQMGWQANFGVIHLTLGVLRKLSNFNWSGIASDVAALTPRLSVNEPLYLVAGFRPRLRLLTDCAIANNSFYMSHCGYH